MNPRTRHSFINEGNNRDRNGNARLYFGDRSQDHFPEEALSQRHALIQSESRSRDGLHFGKAPKSYQRTDSLILEDVNEALTRNVYLDASDIEVRVKDAIVTLTGSVMNRQIKVLAEDCIESILGVKDIKNEICFSGGNFRKTDIKEIL